MTGQRSVPCVFNVVVRSFDSPPVTRQFGRRSGKASRIGAGPAAVVNMEAHANSAEVDILRAAASNIVESNDESGTATQDSAIRLVLPREEHHDYAMKDRAERPVLEAIPVPVVKRLVRNPGVSVPAMWE